jgi:hypothetical protein
MTLDEAIQHCKEVAIEYEAKGECYECGKEHRQLAEWLEDYKELKAHFESLPDWLPVWVSCDEAMPKVGEKVLAFYDYTICGVTNRYMVIASLDHDGYWTAGCTWLPPKSITHWMPLPDPPKGDTT